MVGVEREAPTPSRAPPGGILLPPRKGRRGSARQLQRRHRQLMERVPIMFAPLCFLMVCAAERDAPVIICCVLHALFQRDDVVRRQIFVLNLTSKQAKAAQMAVPCIDSGSGLPPLRCVTEPLCPGILPPLLRFHWAYETDRMHPPAPFARLQHSVTPYAKEALGHHKASVQSFTLLR